MEVKAQKKPGSRAIDDWYPSPCNECHDESCVNSGRVCNRWKTRYFYRQNAINGYARKYLSKSAEPDDMKDPCEGCSSNDNCDTICQARAKWWDARMEKLRKEVGYGQQQE